MSIEQAIVAVETALKQRLTKLQTLIFRQSWEGEPYQAIARSFGYDAGYVKDVGSDLWKQLSGALNEKITKHNFRERVEQLIQKSHASTVPPSQPNSNPAAKLIHNLPARDFSEMIGRDRELARLSEFLFSAHSAHISIEGMGGMGKTTLALAAVAQFLTPSQSYKFEAIIFASAKQERLTPQGILPRLKPERNLQDILRAIARTFNRQDILFMDFDEQLEQIQNCLKHQSTLLIIDNLETVEDGRSILSFLYDLPSTVRVIVTSRQQSPFASIHLDPLPSSASVELIQQQAYHKNISLSSAEIQALHQQTSGVPAAIIYAIGQRASGYFSKHLSTDSTLVAGDYAYFYFKTSMALLQGTLSHYLLMSLALFPGSATIEAIAHIAGHSDLTESINGLAQLQQLSLVKQQAERYTLLALTREYALKELATHPNFEQAARDRWIGWYLDFMQQHGNQDGKEWNDYTLLDQEWDNLQAVSEWCIANDRYDEMRQLWQRANGYTHTRGQRQNRLTVWNIRLDWADWLIQAAEQRQDWATALDVMLDQGWTLTLLGQPRHLAQATTLYETAWNLRHHQSAKFQIELAIQQAVLLIQQQAFAEATHWLQQAQQFLGEVESAATERSRIQINYYHGEIAYKTRQYDQAQRLFQHVLSQSQQLNWQRAIFLAKDWLADIAIAQHHFDNAQQLLDEGLQVAQTNQDQCRVAFCERSLAQLEKARGNEAIAQQWATTAKQRFERLGMQTEVEETKLLLQTL